MIIPRTESPRSALLPLSGKNQGLGFTKPRFLLSPPQGGRYETPPVAQVFHALLRLFNEFNRMGSARRKTYATHRSLSYDCPAFFWKPGLEPTTRKRDGACWGEECSPAGRSIGSDLPIGTTNARSASEGPAAVSGHSPG